MKHLTAEKWKLIENAATAMSLIPTGCRQQKKEYADCAVKLAKQEAKEVKSVPKAYKILYINFINLGTVSYADWMMNFELIDVNKQVTIRETNSSLIAEGVGKRRVLKKNYVVAFIW